MKGNLRYLRVAPAVLLSIALVSAIFFAPTFAAASELGQPAAVATYAPYSSYQLTGSTYGPYAGRQAPYSGYPSNLDCVHVVRIGETLAGIALRYGTTVSTLARANYIFNPNHIFAGMTLRVPCQPVSIPQPCIRTIHVVRFGEDLLRISLRYGLSWTTMAAFNNLNNSNLVFAGIPLVIPCYSSSVSGYPSSYPTPNPAPMSGQVTVVMRNIAFNPSSITIHMGQTVVWINQDSAPHTTTSGSCSGNTCTPAAGWDSGTLNPGQSFSHTFNSIGTFTYFCRIHGAMMQGMVTVIP
jgi:plastocyanin